ncbi:Zn-dependent hydrolase [Desulfosporosinus sp. PR]|uniref:Zn-dependent hydrolase n=1 Tax=Candidatus Desulfosporosinus nitrosoreducens TaxID=3401928 RepID=UPI0027EC4E30|nr:Zn-dependent hydrolase [Desulfosporosinus sp. PR]MDQ7092642.1 Zn-dependent hydrolase [Desulfosporosinus sp. PR]
MINKERLYNRIQELGQIGKNETGGVTCVALSREEKEAMNLVASYMRQAGLDVRMDAAGNLIGRKEGLNPQAPVVMTGSHIDTVYNGGMFDGRLGILGGIEVLQTMNEQGIVTLHPIEVYAYRDEEGTRFSTGYSSARCLMEIRRPDIFDHTDREGISIGQALRDIGIDPERVYEAVLPPGYAKAHVELHIEQGKVLESRNLSVGIVTGICCQSRGRFAIKGEAGHAGATPMNLRRDPLVAAAEIIQVVETEAAKTGTAVATVGKINAHPGGVNIIPGQVEFSIDVRDQTSAIRDAVLDAIYLQAKEICNRRKVELEFKVFNKDSVPKLCDADMKIVISGACETLGIPVFELPSGAGHDSGSFADFCQMGMIFIRSRDGISHSPKEWSSIEDCSDGANVLYQTILKLAIPV